MKRYLATKIMNPAFAAARILRFPSFDGTPYDIVDLSDDEMRHLTEVSQSAQRDFPNRELVWFLGVMPRSGTNFLYELLLLDPRFRRPAIAFDELPILALADRFGDVKSMLSDFLTQSGAAFADHEWMAYAGAGVRNRLLDLAPDDSITIVKDPHVQKLGLFPAIFPKDRLMLIVRDGRYVVDSYVRTFSHRVSFTFEDACREFAAAMRNILTFVERHDDDRVKLIHYEKAARNRRETYEELLTWLGRPLDEATCGELENLPVFGSSTHSRKEGAVDWTPVKADASFDPTKRGLEWSSRQEKLFESICGEVNRQAGYT